MSDAWNAPGWTAQQAATYYTEDGSVLAWRLPADVETVRVEGSFADVDGGRPDGYALFASNTAWKHVPTGTMIQKAKYYTFINPNDGTWHVDIPASDATTLVALDGPTTYDVEIVLNRKVVEAFTCSVPKATTPVNWLDLVQLPDPDGGGVVVGQEPEPLTVVLTEHASFNWSLQRTDSAGLAENWGTAPHLVFTLPDDTEVTWTTAVTGNSAVFNVPAEQVDAVIAANPVATRLYVGDVLWARGGAPTVIR